ncbi:MAG: ribosome small subunit-dependent GTPase A [Ruminococcus sp.]|nr:ribosome small subunit-dependent GTPase A [Ruminococcus sp.]
MEDRRLEGRIIKGIGGFYYVEAADEIFECKARGVFRNKSNTPLVGDFVTIKIPQSGYNLIEKIAERKNSLIRPPVANIDLLMIVCSTVSPLPNFSVIDKMTAYAVYNNIEPVIVITKSDLSDGSEIHDIYEKSAIRTVLTSYVDGVGLDEVKGMLEGKTTAFTGNSGVGKSTLLNALFPGLELATGEISEKLGRGRHTTRAVELIKVDGCYVADTPGFSTVNMEKFGMTDKTELQYSFPEFADYINGCRFNSCSHTCEKGCAVIEKVRDGTIAKTRHKSYCDMYDEVKNFKEWQFKK